MLSHFSFSLQDTDTSPTNAPPSINATTATTAAGCRSSKTLPRGLGGASFCASTYSSASTSTQSSETSTGSGSANTSTTSSAASYPHSSDVYGLYGGLIYVKEDFDPEAPLIPKPAGGTGASGANGSGGAGSGSGGGGHIVGTLCAATAAAYESLRRSDPDLAAIPAKVTTLDRRLRLKLQRPRSLDLSNWSVDSRSSSLYTTSSSSAAGSAESMLRPASSAGVGRSVSRNSSSASSARGASDLRDICENGGADDEAAEARDGLKTAQPARRTMSATSSDVAAAAAKGPPTSSASSTPAAVAAAGPKMLQLQPLATSTLTSATLKRKNKLAAAAAAATTTGAAAGNKSKAGQTDACGRRTIVTLMGGRGYVNWRPVWQCADAVGRAHKSSVVSSSSSQHAAPDEEQEPSSSASAPAAVQLASAVPNASDAHVIVWEKKL